MLFLGLLVLLVFLINFILCDFYSFLSSHKTFECGFDTTYWIHPKLSIHFFKIGIVFVLFDLELILLVVCFTNEMLLLWLLITFIYWSIFLESYLSGFKWAMFKWLETVNFLIKT